MVANGPGVSKPQALLHGIDEERVMVKDLVEEIVQTVKEKFRARELAGFVEFETIAFIDDAHGLHGQFTQKQPYTCVVLFADDGEGTFVHSAGFAKVSGHDKWDSEIGLEYATKRAARGLVRKLQGAASLSGAQ